MLHQDNATSEITVESNWFSGELAIPFFPPMEELSEDLLISFSDVCASESLAFESLKVLPIQLSQTLPRTIGFAFPDSPQWTAPEPKRGRTM
jgi:hypothetical protein